MGVQLLALSTEHIVPLDEMLNYVRVTCEKDNDFVQELIDAACELLEAESETNLLNHSHLEVISSFPVPHNYFGDSRYVEVESYRTSSLLDYPLKLTEAPLVSVTSIQYYDTFGVLQTLSSGNYTVDTVNNYIQPALNCIWPQTYLRTDAVQITYVAGKGAVVPKMAKQAVRLLVSHWYNHMDAVSAEMYKIVPLGFTNIAKKLNDGAYV